jgi:DNA binding domain, excisionase family
MDEKDICLQKLTPIVTKCFKENIAPEIYREINEIKQLVIKLLEGEISDMTVHYFTREEVCKRLNICKATFHNWVNAGKMKSIKIGNRVYVVSSEIDRIMNQ